MRDLLDVVDDGEELPLGVHLASAAEGEAPHALVSQVGEEGFDGWHAAAVDGASCGTIKLPAHAFGGRVLASARLGYPFTVLDDHELALDGALWVAQALGSKRTTSAGGDGCLEVSNAVAVEEHVFAALVKLVSTIALSDPPQIGQTDPVIGSSARGAVGRVSVGAADRPSGSTRLSG